MFRFGAFTRTQNAFTLIRERQNWIFIFYLFCIASNLCGKWMQLMLK